MGAYKCKVCGADEIEVANVPRFYFDHEHDFAPAKRSAVSDRIAVFHGPAVSEQAIEMAETLCDPYGNKMAVAAALQQLMDERDGANAGYCEPLERMRTRAEAAEAQLAEAERLWEADRERARKMTEAATLEHKRTAEANGRLAELVRKLREWQQTPFHEGGNRISFDAILAAYEAGR
jgi:hypothetical protein